MLPQESSRCVGGVGNGVGGRGGTDDSEEDGDGGGLLSSPRGRPAAATSPSDASAAAAAAAAFAINGDHDRTRADARAPPARPPNPSAGSAISVATADMGVAAATRRLPTGIPDAAAAIAASSPGAVPHLHPRVSGVRQLSALDRRGTVAINHACAMHVSHTVRRSAGSWGLNQSEFDLY